MWTQVVGKVKLAKTPLVNHWWNVALYVTPRGLTTGNMPYKNLSFEVEFDFVDHKLWITSNDGGEGIIPLVARTVADFYHEVMKALEEIGIQVKIWTTPVEIPDPIPFEKDTIHRSYDPEFANRFWRVLLHCDKVMNEFRSRFLGKCSPVHFFWGSFDMAVTRFSGRTAVERTGADPITREAYSHEVISHGFWPGNAAFPEPAYYSYTAPEPSVLAHEKIRPEKAFYSRELSEFVLRYDDVRKARLPEETLMNFLQSTYEAGARLANWDRNALERHS